MPRVTLLTSPYEYCTDQTDVDLADLKFTGIWPEATRSRGTRSDDAHCNMAAMLG